MGAAFQSSLSGRGRWARRLATWRRSRYPRRSRQKLRPMAASNTEVDYAANITLKPGETYSTPRSFVSVYTGDFLRAAPDLVERSPERRLGTPQAIERSLQRELVRLGIRGERYSRRRCWAQFRSSRRWASSG